MTFLRYRRWIVMAAGLFFLGFIVWPYVHGGGSSIHTGFELINSQMEEVIAESADLDVAAAPKGTVVTTRRPVLEPTHKPTSDQIGGDGEGESSLLDLNAATLQQLNDLPGIGDSKAKAIIDYRTKKGRFSRVDELTEVKGIGEKMLMKLRDYVFVTSS